MNGSITKKFRAAGGSIVENAHFARRIVTGGMLSAARVGAGLCLGVAMASPSSAAGSAPVINAAVRAPTVPQSAMLQVWAAPSDGAFPEGAYLLGGNGARAYTIAFDFDTTVEGVPVGASVTEEGSGRTTYALENPGRRVTLSTDKGGSTLAVLVRGQDGRTLLLSNAAGETIARGSLSRNGITFVKTNEPRKGENFATLSSSGFDLNPAFISNPALFEIGVTPTDVAALLGTATMALDPMFRGIVATGQNGGTYAPAEDVYAEHTRCNTTKNKWKWFPTIPGISVYGKGVGIYSPAGSGGSSEQTSKVCTPKPEEK